MRAGWGSDTPGSHGYFPGCEVAAHPDLTVTIGFWKAGLVAETAGMYIKGLVCADAAIVPVREAGYLTEETCPLWDTQILSVLG